VDAKDNFNTYIPTGEKLSQLRIGGVREKDVLEYNIRHLVKAINTDLKKKYMKDFVAEGKLNEHEVIFSKGEMATLHKDGKLVKKDDEGKDHTYIFTDEGKVNEATPAKVQKAQKELVTTIELLKKNFPLYKSAMESGDEKKLEKHRKIALDLTKKKKQLEKSLELELQGLYANAELKLENVGDDTWKSFLGDDPAFKLYTATNTEKRKTVQARKTNKTWDDGVPVLKYIARDSKKDHPLPKGKFKIIEDNKHGWWYYNIGSTWYGIQQKDYGTPPFEY
jgi:predicted transcriptional regulator